MTKRIINTHVKKNAPAPAISPQLIIRGIRKSSKQTSKKENAVACTR